MSTLVASARPASRLAVYCTALGVRTCDLAEAVQVNASYMSSVIHGQRTPSRRLRRDISTALQVPEEDLWGEQ